MATAPRSRVRGLLPRLPFRTARLSGATRRCAPSSSSAASFLRRHPRHGDPAASRVGRLVPVLGFALVLIGFVVANVLINAAMLK